MEAERYRGLLKAITQGAYSVPDGRIRISSDLSGWSAPEAVECHEYVHMEITDNSGFGYFQRLLWSLARAPITPKWLAEAMQRTFDASMSACFLTHEGLATYRSLSWYHIFSPAYAGDLQAALPSDYAAALRLVEPIMPRREYSVEAHHAGLQALCTALGVFLMSRPVFEVYANIQMFTAEDLPFVTRDTPDDLLRSVSGNAGVQRVLERELEYVSGELGSRRRTEFQAMYPAWIDAVFARLSDVCGQSSTMSWRDRGPNILRMLKAWEEAVPEFAGRLVHPQVEQQFLRWPPADVYMEQMLYKVAFTTMGDSPLVGMSFDVVANCDNFVSILESCSGRDELPFVFLGNVNPDAEPIPHAEEQMLGPNTVTGFIGKLDLSSGIDPEHPVSERVSTFILPCDSFARVVNDSLPAAVWYLNSSVRGRAESQFRMPGLVISRDVSLRDFAGRLPGEGIRACDSGKYKILFCQEGGGSLLSFALCTTFQMRAFAVMAGSESGLDDELCVNNVRLTSADVYALTLWAASV